MDSSKKTQAPRMTKKHATEIVHIAFARAMAQQLNGALAAREVYYNIPHVARSGMLRHVQLAYIDGAGSRPTMSVIWPRLDETTPGIEEACELLGGWHIGTSIAARLVGFSFEKRAFIVGGCGFDAVQHVLDSLASLASAHTGLDETQQQVWRRAVASLSQRSAF